VFRRRRPREIRESCLEIPVPGGALSCRLRRSNARRTLALRVDEAGQVVVNAPQRTAVTAITAFVVKHLDWIYSRQSDSRALAMHWTDGTRLPYLGRELILRLEPLRRRGEVRLQGEELRCAAGADQVESLVLGWYQHHAREFLGRRLQHHAQRLGRAVPALRLSNARTRWGSLSPNGVVSLNWRLLKGDQEEIDYVICHELAHFRHRNHSPAFWREVETLFPGWETVRKRLRENGRRYFQF